MNFASLQFGGFFVLLFIAYWLLRRSEHQNTLLLLASYYFYGSWDPRFLLLIWLVTGASYLAGSRIAASADPLERKRWLIGYATFAMALLGVFKYLDFFIGSAQSALSALGFNSDPMHLRILLPAAISFFTFESLSYVIEIYQRHLPGTTRFKHYALFIAYFPKLVAGPIERPAVLVPQIQKPRTMTEEGLTRGLFLIMLGLFKKIVVADGLAPTVASVFDSPGAPGGLDIVLGSYAFALQIYCDFSGYTDIARGISKMLGIELSLNFRFPYFSSNPSEFWRRWHISLSTWLRDYLYIPLGGNRRGTWRTSINQMVTMLLGGLWHGAAWNYVLWGGYQGLLLVVHQLFGARGKVFTSSPIGKVLGTVVFFQFVCYGWLLFRARSFEQIGTYTARLIDIGHWGAPMLSKPSSATLVGAGLLIVYDFFAYRSGRATFYRRWAVPLRSAVYAVFVFVTVMGLANQRSAFIYFQF